MALRNRNYQKAGILYLLVLIFLFPKIFLLQDTFFYGDNYSLVVPGKLYIKEAFQQGELPYYNLLTNGGVPFLGEINQAIFYPTTLLFLIFAPGIALSVSVLLQYWVAAMGVFFTTSFFTREFWPAWTAGAAFMLSQHILSSGNNLATIQSAAYIGFVIGIWLRFQKNHAYRGRYLLPLLFLLQILGGLPQPVVYTHLFLLGLWIMNSSQRLIEIKYYFFSVAVAFLMGAFIFVPFVQLASYSSRLALTVDQVVHGSAHPLHYIQVFLPNFFSDPHKGIAWGPDWSRTRETGPYVSLLLIISLFLFSRKLWRYKKYKPWLLLLGLSIFWSMAGYIPVIRWLYDNFSFLRLIRSPSGIVFLVVFISSVLGSVSLYAYLLKMKLNAVIGWSLIIVTIGLGLVFVFFDRWIGLILSMLDVTRSAFFTIERSTLIIEMVITRILVAGGILLLGYVLIRRKFAPWMLAVVVVGDLALAAQPSIFTAPLSIYNYQESGQAAWLNENLGQEYRFLSASEYIPFTGLEAYMTDATLQPPFGDTWVTEEEKNSFDEITFRRDNLSPNWHLPHLLPSLFGYNTLTLQSALTYFSSENVSNNPANRVDRLEFSDHRIAEFSVQFILADEGIAPKEVVDMWFEGLEKVYSRDRFSVYQVSRSKPVIQSIDDQTIITSIVRGINSYRFTLNSTDASTVDTTLFWYPGWKCLLDTGLPCQIETDENNFMRLHISAGEYLVDLTYKPENFSYLLIISIGSIIFYGLFVIRGIQRVRLKAI